LTGRWAYRCGDEGGEDTGEEGIWRKRGEGRLLGLGIFARANERKEKKKGKRNMGKTTALEKNGGLRETEEV